MSLKLSIWLLRKKSGQFIGPMPRAFGDFIWLDNYQVLKRGGGRSV